VFLNVKHDKAFKKAMNEYTRKEYVKIHPSVSNNSGNPSAEIGMSFDQFNYYNALVKEQHSDSMANQENIKIIDFYRDAFHYLTKKYELNMKEVIQDLATAGIEFPKVSHTEQRLGSEHLQLPAKPVVPIKEKKPKPEIEKFKFSFKKLSNDGTWIEVPQTGDMIVQYKENEPLVVKVENLHDFPVYFAVYEKRDGKFMKEYPKNNPTALKMLPSVGDTTGHSVEISCGKCKISDKFNRLDEKELQTTVVEVTSTSDIEEMKSCSILIPLSIFVEVSDNIIEKSEPFIIDPISITSTTSTTTTYQNPKIETDDISDLLKQLSTMGFSDPKKNEDVLRRNNKNIDKTISELVSYYL